MNIEIRNLFNVATVITALSIALLILAPALFHSPAAAPPQPLEMHAYNDNKIGEPLDEVFVKSLHRILGGLVEGKHLKKYVLITKGADGSFRACLEFWDSKGYEAFEDTFGRLRLANRVDLTPVTKCP